MPRATSEMYEVVEEPTSITSTGTGDVKTVQPATLLGKRATGVWVSVEGAAARVTFGGTTPGAGAGPGIVIPAGAMPAFYPFAIAPLLKQGNPLKFASNTTSASIMSVIFVQ